MRIIGLDVGEKRIGVARADSDTRIAVPIGFINVDGTEWEEIEKIAKANNTNLFVLGLPRSNEGNETAQTLFVRNFARSLTGKIPNARIKFQDESLTSVEAERRLKTRRKRYEKGEIDAEAASIILQDFIENFKEPETKVSSETNIIEKEVNKVRRKTKRITAVVSSAGVLLIIGIFCLASFLWGKSQLSPVSANCNNQNYESECEREEFVVNDGESKSEIAENLESKNLIKNATVFKIYAKIFKSKSDFKAGAYLFHQGMSALEIMDELEKGPENDPNKVFSFTIKPGETIFDVKKSLMEVGYSEREVDEALNADYDFNFLRNRPSDATLEGYLFGETHEFYKTASVKEIIETFLVGMEGIIVNNDLETRYKEKGLSLYEGITLASIVQKEAHSKDQPTVAQVFLSRLSYGIPLGSDVTVSYALDKIDPLRETYIDNQSALLVDSCYNTRVNAGLPCGPISNPGLSALISVAEPSDTTYLYFLTGDDGVMYYSYTESEHIQNIYSHCQELCNVSL